LKLSELKIGDKGEIRRVNAKGDIRRRILDMGLVDGVRFKVIRVAPLGDPIEIKVRGFFISLRMEEAGEIEVFLKGHIGDRKPMRKVGPLFSPYSFQKKRIRQDRFSDNLITVALMGNPNSGKTSIFNSIVGSHQRVGNFPGVTVEKYEGIIKYGKYNIKFIDLPGTYSLMAYSPEEVIARNYIIEKKPDVVVNVIDGTNLERNLYLTTQLMELETDLLVALNMNDEVNKKGMKIDFKQLQKLLGSHVIPTSAISGEGIKSLMSHIVRVYEGKISIKKNKLTYSSKIELIIENIARLIDSDIELTEFYNPRWMAIKLLENDRIVLKILKKRPIWIRVEKELKDAISICKTLYKSDSELCITEDRHSFIKGAIQETVTNSGEEKRTITDKIDSILLNRILGIPIFILIMWSIFQFTFTLGQPIMELIDKIFKISEVFLGSFLADGVFKSLLIDGIIAGVGGVLVFLPNIFLLFLSIALLEGTGYMSRAAFVIDKVMHMVGLHGKSFIPMITGFGCSVPAFMATRTLKNRSDKIVTMMIIPFMSCSAKLPVYILLIGAFFPTKMAGNILFGIYIFGVFIAILSAKILKKAFFKGESEPFVMELPPYRMPTVKSLLYQSNHKVKMYIKKAGTVILLASILIWGASNFPKSEKIDNDFDLKINNIKLRTDISNLHVSEQIKRMEMNRNSEQLKYSIAGRLGRFIEPVIRPLGFDWRIGVSLVAGLAAKEVVVSTLGTIFSLGEADETKKLSERLSADGKINKSIALALMIFVLLYVPCIAATTVFFKESGSWKWTQFYIFYTIFVAWVVSFIIYRLSFLIFK